MCFLVFSSERTNSERQKDWLVVTICFLGQVTFSLHCFFICKSVSGLPQRCFPQTSVNNTVCILEGNLPRLYMSFYLYGLKLNRTNKPQECCLEVSIKSPNLQVRAMFRASNRKPVLKLTLCKALKFQSAKGLKTHLQMINSSKPPSGK